MSSEDHCYHVYQYYIRKVHARRAKRLPCNILADRAVYYSLRAAGIAT